MITRDQIQNKLLVILAHLRTWEGEEPEAGDPDSTDTILAEIVEFAHQIDNPGAKAKAAK